MSVKNIFSIERQFSPSEKFPDHFSSYSGELHAIQETSGIYFHHKAAVLEMRGKDSLDFLHRISTNSTKDMQPGDAVTTLILTDKGKLIDRIEVLSFDEKVVLIGSPGNAVRLKEWIERFIFVDDVTVKDITINSSLFELLGPASHKVLEQLKLKKPEIQEFFKDDLNDKVLYCKYENRYMILISSNSASTFIDTIINTAGTSLIGRNAYEYNRISCGEPAFPSEISEELNPHEAGLIHFVDFNKGCYTGQEVIARLDSYDKVSKKISILVSANNSQYLAGAKLIDRDGIAAGTIRSVQLSPDGKTEKIIALIRKKYWDFEQHFYTEDDKNFDYPMTNTTIQHSSHQ